MPEQPERTLYTIGFYVNPKKDGMHPGKAMGFFGRKIRDQVYALIIRQIEENGRSNGGAF